MKVSFRDMDIFSKNEEDKDIFFKNGEKIRDWGYVDPPLVAPFYVVLNAKMKKMFKLKLFVFRLIKFRHNI